MFVNQQLCAGRIKAKAKGDEAQEATKLSQGVNNTKCECSQLDF